MSKNFVAYFTGQLTDPCVLPKLLTKHFHVFKFFKEAFAHKLLTAIFSCQQGLMFFLFCEKEISKSKFPSGRTK